MDESISYSQNRRRAVLQHGYVEGHHICPKSIFGEYLDSLNNIVFLHSREHFVCHLLLTKMFTGERKEKMTFAFNYMRRGNSKRYVSSFYSKRKLEMPSANKRKIHITDGMYTKLHNKTDKIPDGWKTGCGKFYKQSRKQINDRVHRKTLKVVDLKSNLESFVKNLKKWSCDKQIPYSTITSSIRKGHIVRERYLFSWVEN